MIRYYSSSGKKTTRQIALAGLTAGSHVTIEATIGTIKIEKIDGEYRAECKQHNAKCRMSTPLRAIEWVESHLRQYHETK